MRHRLDETADPRRTTLDLTLGRAVIALLRGVVERDGAGGVWADLLRERGGVRDHLRVIGLELVIDEADGFAYARSAEEGAGDADAASLPRLTPRQPLSYGVSLLLALLRKRLAELDAHGGETRLVLTEAEVVEMVSTFLPAGSNQVGQVREARANLQKVVKLGFARRLPDAAGTRSVEVKRYLKAFVDAQWLHEFDLRLEAYAAGAENEELAEQPGTEAGGRSGG